jgi:hypothetical protein
LALLALHIIEAALGGWADQQVVLERLERPLPLGWEEQRAALGRGQPRDSESGWSGALCLLAQRRGPVGGRREIRPRDRALRQTPNVT